MDASDFEKVFTEYADCVISIKKPTTMGTTLTTKRSIDDAVFVLLNGKVEKHLVNKIMITLAYSGTDLLQIESYGLIDDDGNYVTMIAENLCFDTKEQLLASL